jgi:hypothetical protein
MVGTAGVAATLCSAAPSSPPVHLGLGLGQPAARTNLSSWGAPCGPKAFTGCAVHDLLATGSAT